MRRESCRIFFVPALLGAMISLNLFQPMRVMSQSENMALEWAQKILGGIAT